MGRMEAIEKRLADVKARYPAADLRTTTPTGAVFVEGPAAVLAVLAPSDLVWCLARIRKLEAALRQALTATESGPLGPDLRGWEINLLHARLDTALAEDP